MITLFERFGNQGEFVLLVGRLGETLERRSLDHRLAEGHHRVGHLDVDLRVQLPLKKGFSRLEKLFLF
jgi:hypothetical protein